MSARLGALLLAVFRENGIGEVGAVMKKWVCVLAVVLVGLIAGLLLGTGMDQYTSRQLTASAWTTGHQVMDELFRRVLPTLWNMTVLMLLVATFVAKGSGRWLFAAAAGLLVIALALTITVEVPMNRQIALWNPAAPPADWADVRDNWLAFHLARTIAGIAAFLCATVGLTKMRSVPRY